MIFDKVYLQFKVLSTGTFLSFVARYFFGTSPTPIWKNKKHALCPTTFMKEIVVVDDKGKFVLLIGKNVSKQGIHKLWTQKYVSPAGYALPEYAH